MTVLELYYDTYGFTNKCPLYIVKGQNNLGDVKEVTKNKVINILEARKKLKK